MYVYILYIQSVITESSLLKQEFKIKPAIIVMN